MLAHFLAFPQECPIQTAQEFAEGTPFRILAEGKWWGKDLFREKFGDGLSSERLEIGLVSQADLVELSEGEWLAWQDGHWQKYSCVLDGKIKPIARIQSVQGKSLYLEGWDKERHVRLCLNPALGPSVKIRGEDLFSSIRIRSEKQISCMLEKQCLILKIGDWVLKTNGRWRILRKKEERESYLNGILAGDLFVFEKIEMKQGQKSIQGQLFNTGRSQVFPIEMTAHIRKSAKDPIVSGEKGTRKGRFR